MQKSALITGCSKGGIGDALALEFHERGVRVFSTARNLSKVEHHQALGIEVLQLDVTDEESIEHVVKEVEKLTGGKLDFLVNNAGIGYTKPLLDADLKVAKDVFDLNFFSVLAVTQAFAPQIIAAKGKVINIGSIVGKMAQPYYGMLRLRALLMIGGRELMSDIGVYNASKAAANLLSETLRLELAPFGVQVITVITGVINTQFFRKQGAVHLPSSKPSLPSPTLHPFTSLPLFSSRSPIWRFDLS